MSVALRTITRLQDADDINVTLGVGVDEYALCWDNDTSRFVLRAMSSGGVTDHGALTGLADDDHSQYLLATGTRTGASSQAQTFTNGIIGPSWKPASDSTTALQLQNAAGTAVLNVDTTNSRVGIGTSAPDTPLHVHAGSAGAVDAYPASVLALESSSHSYVNFLPANGSAAGFVIGQGATSNKTFFTYSRLFNGNWDLTANVVGGGFGYVLANTDNTNAQSDAFVEALVGGASAGDPKFVLTVSGENNWAIGIDNNYEDRLRIGPNAQLAFASAIVITTAGLVGLNTATPATRLDIDAGAMTMAEMTAPTGVANKATLYAKDSGAGKTQLCVKLGDDVEIVLAVQA